MAPEAIAKHVRRRLASELREELAVAERLAASVGRLVEDVDTPAWTRSLALAYEVDRFYTCVESLLLRSLRALDGDGPSGASWHQDVLLAAMVEVKDLRPRIITREAADHLKELLRFRHFARHGYAVDPDPVLMHGHGLRVLDAARHVSASLRDFCEWLDA